jgi:glycerol-3-phosphate dehydrogenase
MAEDAVNAAIAYGGLSPSNKCVTKELMLMGGEGWEPSRFTVLSQNYVQMKKNSGGKIVPAIMDTAVAKHLSHSYGSLADRVAKIAQVGSSSLL